MRSKIFLPLMLIITLLCLVSCSGTPVAEFEGDGYTCLLYASGGTVKSIAVNNNDTYKASFRIKNAQPSAAPSYGFELIDMNFDGVRDMRLLISSSEDGDKYFCKIWNPSFTRFTSDDTLNTLLSPTFDAQTQTVSSPYSKHITEPAVGDVPEVYIDESGTNTYEWRQGVLTAVRRDCVTYYSESDIYCVAIWEINADGELEATEEHWYSPEQYKHAGIEP